MGWKRGRYNTTEASDAIGQHFPEEIIHRYPSLTVALGDNYPGLRRMNEGHQPRQNDYLPANAPSIGLRKSCDWTECRSFSARLSDLQTHENMPSSKQRERSNLKRHQVTAHGVPRRTRAQKTRSLAFGSHRSGMAQRIKYSYLEAAGGHENRIDSGMPGARRGGKGELVLLCGRSINTSISTRHSHMVEIQTVNFYYFVRSVHNTYSSGLLSASNFVKYELRRAVEVLRKGIVAVCGTSGNAFLFDR
ncbi:hypothetical protein B0H13DRAFT_1850282 [Mycena leptocephala]|nr:hypothetical protein B0H13DRAFT_1850282 [Mycena leptocephala]